MYGDAKLFDLRNLIDLRSGFPFRGAISEMPGGPVGVVQMKDIDPTGVVHWGDVIRTELSGRRPPEWLASADILFVSRGSRFYAVCLDVPPSPAVCSPHLFHMRLRTPTQVLPKFLAWQLNQPPLQRQLQAAAEGSSQLSIRRSALEALSISVPSLEDQRRIVQIVDAAARERSLLHALIRNREQHLATIALSLAQAAGTPAPLSRHLS